MPPRNSSNSVRRVDPEVPAVAVNAAGSGTEPQYATDWSNLTGATALTITRLGPFVIVYGQIKKGIAGVANETIFTLPVGSRPATQTEFITSTAGSGIARIYVGSDGVVKWLSGTPTTSLDVLGLFRAA